MVSCCPAAGVSLGVSWVRSRARRRAELRRRCCCVAASSGRARSDRPSTHRHTILRSYDHTTLVLIIVRPSVLLLTRLVCFVRSLRFYASKVVSVDLVTEPYNRVRACASTVHHHSGIISTAQPCMTPQCMTQPCTTPPCATDVHDTAVYDTPRAARPEVRRIHSASRLHAQPPRVTAACHRRVSPP